LEDELVPALYEDESVSVLIFEQPKIAVITLLTWAWIVIVFTGIVVSWLITTVLLMAKDK
jgi:hypothetical protein